MTPTTTVPRHLWTRTIHRLGGMSIHNMSHDQRVTYTARMEVAFNARRGTK